MYTITITTPDKLNAYSITSYVSLNKLGEVLVKDGKSEVEIMGTFKSKNITTK